MCGNKGKISDYNFTPTVLFKLSVGEERECIFKTMLIADLGIK